MKISLFKYLKYKKTLVFGFLTKTIEVVLELFLPILMAVLMEQGLKNSNIDIGIKYSLLIIIFALLGYITTLYSQYASAKVSLDYAKNLREAMFNHTLDIALKDSEKFSSATLLNRMNLDVNNLQNSVAMTVRIASRAPVLMVGSVIALFILNKQVALVLLIGLPILITFLILIMYFSIILYQKFKKENDALTNIVADNIEGARMIRSFAKSEYEEERFQNRSDALSKVLVKMGRVSALSNPITTLIMNILLVIMLYLGIVSINNGSMTDSQLLQIINYITQLSFSIIGVMNLILLYTKASSSKQRINEVLAAKDTILNDDQAIFLNKDSFEIEFKNVTFTHDDSKLPVLKKFNLVIKPNETLGVVGLTGSGKTTFVDLLMRFYDVDEGEILINGININKYDIHSLRDKIAYANQKPVLFSTTVKENIEMGKKYRSEVINNALRDSAADFVYNDDLGVNKEVNRGGNNFSGGQKQRIDLARALAKDSVVLILDDVFSALDYQTDFKIRKALEKRKQTKIYISQRLSSLYYVDKIIVVEDGSIKALGTHDELLKESKLYKALHDTQVLGGV